MKFSEKWLREWTNPAISTTELVEQLTMAGLEVDSVEQVANSFNHVVVGHVIDIKPHPNADKLKVCRVDVGSEVLQIVCGANNVTQGVKVPAALCGAEISPDFKIKPSKLRGEDSFGMLCSAKELGLQEQSDGLLLLPNDAPTGKLLREYMQLDDVCIEVDLTPNRGDCLSIAGLAREVAVLNRSDYMPIQTSASPAVIDELIDIQLSAETACPHYVSLVINGVDLMTATPLWLTEKLRRSGIRSIDPIVDITNYVMLELGQPMHAFDKDKISGALTVRFAQQGERLTLLNMQEIQLTENDLVIADAQKVIALAGIMGGAETAVTSQTQNILLESAHFTPEVIAGRARYHGLSTDSSHRFERGVDMHLQQVAIERAQMLILQITGGQSGQINPVLLKENQPRQINLRHNRIARLLGVVLDKTEIEDILTRLGMILTPDEMGWQVTVPTNRFDISIEEDLIEELVRIYGYDRIEATTPMFTLSVQPQSERKITLRRFKQLLVDRDYHEIITYSFVAAKTQALITPNIEPCVLLNPISEELGVMRTSLWTGLLQTYLYNKNRQQQRLRLFESGLIFSQVGEEILQSPNLAGLISGDISPAQWGEPLRSVDFFDIKADVEAILALSGLHQKVSYLTAKHEALHPGQSAEIFYGDESIGLIGALHPSVAQKLTIKAPVFLFELNLTAIMPTELPKFATLSKYPLIRRDIALVVNAAVSAGDIQQCIAEVAGELLVDLQLFDVYQGKGILQGDKSLALGIYLQHHDRTLQDEEVNELIQRIVDALAQKFDAKLRE